MTVKDEVFGLVNVGANGKYSLSITDPKLFAENLMGVKNRYTVADLKSFVTPQIAMYFKEIVTEKQMFDSMEYYEFVREKLIEHPDVMVFSPAQM